MYGQPREIGDHRVEIETKPYIIWEYDHNPSISLMSGGQRAQFIFLDRQGQGDFVLVHSNVVGETYNATGSVAKRSPCTLNACTSQADRPDAG